MKPICSHSDGSYHQWIPSGWSKSKNSDNLVSLICIACLCQFDLCNAAEKKEFKEELEKIQKQMESEERVSELESELEDVSIDEQNAAKEEVLAIKPID